MWDKQQPYPLDAHVQHFPATRVAHDKRRHRLKRLVDARFVCAEECDVGTQSEAGDEEDACQHHAMRAPLR